MSAPGYYDDVVIWPHGANRTAVRALCKLCQEELVSGDLSLWNVADAAQSHFRRCSGVSDDTLTSGS